jgi:hypothetical protein
VTNLSPHERDITHTHRLADASALRFEMGRPERKTQNAKISYAPPVRVL